MMRAYLTLPGIAISLALLLLPVAGCGVVADQERLVIATVGDREITRRDFNMELRRLPPQDKPTIATHEDMVRVLEDFINREALVLEADRLAAQGIIAVPDQAAEEHYFSMNPEIVDVRPVEDPSLFMVDAAGLEAMKAAINEGIEEARRDLLAEQALTYLVQDALATGAIPITEAEYDAAYQAFQEELKDFERVWVQGMLFPILPETDGLVQRVAADARRKIDAGATIEEVTQQYLAGGPGNTGVLPAERLALPLETDIPNDPRLPQYRGFWDDIGTAKAGEIIGPINVQPTTRFVPGPDGRPRREVVPPSLMLVELLRHEPARPLTRAESRDQLAPRILQGKVMEQVRARHNGRVIEANLPAPGSYADGQPSVMRQ